MSEITKRDIPIEKPIDTDDLDVDLPALPGQWDWSTANHVDLTNKVNIFFGFDQTTAGGYIGEIDNFIDKNREAWCLAIRPIVEIPGNGTGNRPREEAETTDTFATLDEAISAVPGHIQKHYAEQTVFTLSDD